LTAFLLFLPAALVVMACAAYTVCKRSSSAAREGDVMARANAGCRLGSISSLMLALAGLGCLGSPASGWGWAMIMLGLLGATAGYLVVKRHLSEPHRSATHRGGRSWPREEQE
jgi:hypothetical protein